MTITTLKTKLYGWLRWSERYTKTDMVYLAKGGFWLTLGQVISTLSGFLLAVAFANFLPKETYGVYKYVLSVVAILTSSTLAGMGTALTQTVARGNDKTLLPAVKTKVKWGSLGAIVSVFFAAYYFVNGSSNLTLSFLIVSLFLPFMDSLGLFEAYLQGKKLFAVTTKYSIIVKITAAIAIIAAILLTKNVVIILLAYFASYTVMRAMLLIITYSKYVKNGTTDYAAIKYGKHLSFMGVLSNFAQYLDGILIYHFLGPAELAVFTIAIAPPEQLKGLFRNLSSLILPKYSARDIREIKHSIIRKMMLASAVIGILVVFYILLAPYVYKLFFPEYLNSIFYSQIFSISLIAVVVFLPLSAMQSQKMTAQLYKFNITSAVIQLILVAALIYPFGIMGAVLARSFYRLFNILYATWLLQRN